jgi:hypothetical protein
MNQYLLRIWGKDEDVVTSLRPPDAVEPSGTKCYWFATDADREAFIGTFPPSCWVMRDKVNPEDADTRAYTVALVTLTLPDGRVGMFEMNFGFGYPDDGVEYMWQEGNYSCDCNKRLYLARECDIDPEFEEFDTENACGDTIALTGLEIFHRKVL